MQFTIIKGWLVTDTTRVRLAAVTAYSPYAPYGEMGIELVTPATVHRFTLTTEAPSEPEPTLAAAVAACDSEDAARQQWRAALEQRAARHRVRHQRTLTTLLADLDAYFAKTAP